MKASTAVLVCCCLAAAVADDAYTKNGVVPDVIDAPPAATLEVKYDGDVHAQLGNVVTPTQVQKQPAFSWAAEEGALYTLIMTGPDPPSRPNRHEFLHMIVANIPGVDVSKGDVLFDYIGSGPPKVSGLHVYVFLVYKQPGHIDFNQEKVPSTSFVGRPMFSARKFAAAKNLGAPVAGNFFRAAWDDYVPVMYKTITDWGGIVL